MHGEDEKLIGKKSKSQIKREMHALQDLCKELVRLNAEQLAKIPLTEELREAIAVVRSMNKHGARYRQMQYIGRLIRDVDASPIQQALDALRSRDSIAVALMHRLQRWRDQLITGNENTLNEVLAAFPDADRQYLRQLIRSAQQELSDGKPAHTARKLFRYLRELFDQHSSVSLTE